MAQVFSLTPSLASPIASPIASPNGGHVPALSLAPPPAAAPGAPAGFEAVLQAAWHGTTQLLDLMQQADAYQASGQPLLAVALYQAWLHQPRTTHDHLAWFNLGVILFGLGDTHGAQQAYARAIQRAPSFMQPRFNLGLVYERLGQSDAAVAQWSTVRDRTHAQHPDERALHLLALNNLGRHLEDQRRYTDAHAALTASLRVQPNQPDVIHHWVFQRAKQCLWPVYEALPGMPDVAMQRQHTSALAMIALSADPQEQLAAAQNYVRNKLNTQVPALAPAKAYGHRRLRIAYASSDFCQHPVAMLTAELFELHDRNAFELFAFDWSPEDGSNLRQRIRRSFDHFIRIDHLSDAAAAELIRSHEIDILIDLHGQTSGARANMLAYRPAPVQITYLGLPATTGFPFIDYVLADRYLIPPECAHHYSERPLYMPDIYQVSDRQRVAAPAPTRSACGLPEHGVVLCCMNNNYKITPEAFAAWMRILHQVPDAVLWLLADNAQSPTNLRLAAQAHGIDAQRLVFAGRAATPDYLARYAVADLFLDTFPFNAGTTANDALWMGLPLLTLSGSTFAARMAGALLTAAGLPELITTDMRSYEQRAVQLASQPEQLQALRQRLQQSRQQSALFDIPRWVRQYEAVLQCVLPGHTSNTAGTTGAA